MKERLLTAAGAILLAISVVLVIWQGSFTFGDYAPTSIEQTYLFWAASTFIFLLMVTLGFMLFRTVVRLYIERQANRERTGIKAKMVIGALALSFMPVFFMVLFSISVLNRNLDKWFSRPAEQIQLNLVQISQSLENVVAENARSHAEWLAARPELLEYLRTGEADHEFFDSVCREKRIGPVHLETADGRRLVVCGEPEEAQGGPPVTVELPLEGAGARLSVTSRVPVDLADKQQEINRSIAEYEQLRLGRKATRATYLLLLALITLFILFVATWIALFLAKQINVPIAALLAASDEVRQGNLSYRVDVPAIDELASLVKSFNEMTAALEMNARELERRRRFIEAILDNVPTGVVSVSAAGEIQRVNRALSQIFGAERVQAARLLSDLLPREQAPEVRRLMNRARRTGVASRQFEFRDGGRTLHLAVTVSALGERESPGFVVVIEDTTELLRAQKSAAWREVARRVAHEIKNPLTPISLSAQRIARQVERAAAGEKLPEGVVRILKECAATIVQETDSVRTLVNEFSSLARFPAAQPEPADLNEVVRNGLAVFEGRLPGIEIKVNLADDLPPVRVDRELFKRVIVNLVDNSAEAMEETPVKRLTVATRPAGPDAVELEVTDTGCGISMEDKEKLFLPYFSTKERGTGLGLAIVSQIVSEHGGNVRVEDNSPCGARFIVELPVFNGGSQAGTERAKAQASGSRERS